MTIRFTWGLVFFALLAFSAQAETPDPWQKPWPSVKTESAQKCAKMFDSFYLQALCMENEEKGYEQMKKYQER